LEILEESQPIKLVSIDPGVKKSAIALWDKEGKLLFADDLPNAQVVRLLRQIRTSRLVVETPVLYPTQRAKHKDVKDLAKVARVFKSFVPKGVGVKPSVWKGQVPKKIHGNRILLALDKEELLRVASIGNHNTIDAIGIGLWALGRIKRGGC